MKRFGLAVVWGALMTLLMQGAAATVLALPVAAAAESGCGVGKPLVNVTYRFLNQQDFTSSGEVWALTDGRSTFRLYDTGDGTFCLIRKFAGSFTTFEGPSPAGTGTVPEGHSGRWVASATVLLVGTYAPTLPTRGFLGTFDAQCDQFQCQNPIQLGYVEVTEAARVPPSWARYVSSCGVLVQTLEGDTGDIACA